MATTPLPSLSPSTTVPAVFRRQGQAFSLAIGLASSLAIGALPARAQQAGYGQTIGISPQERQIYGGSGTGSGSSSPLDAKNPIDLINQLRRSTSLDDATPPSTAVDQALKALEAPQPAPGLEKPGPVLKAP
jgi:hypothetical protein